MVAEEDEVEVAVLFLLFAFAFAPPRLPGPGMLKNDERARQAYEGSQRNNDENIFGQTYVK